MGSGFDRLIVEWQSLLRQVADTTPLENPSGNALFLSERRENSVSTVARSPAKASRVRCQIFRC